MQFICGVRFTAFLFGLIPFLLLLSSLIVGGFAPAYAAPAGGGTQAAEAAGDGNVISRDPRVLQARELFKQKDYIAALELLRTVERGRRDWKDIDFLRGMAAIEGGAQVADEDERIALLEEAAAAFRRILISDPTLIRVRLELARALFFMEKDEAAKEHFERVVASDAHANIKANVQRFLNAIHGRRSWKWHFGMGITRDTNIDSTSKERVYRVGDRNSIFSRKMSYDLPDVDSGYGVSTWTGFEHSQFESGKMVYTGNISRSEYKGRKSDSMILGASAGPRWFFDGGRKRLQTSLTLRRDWDAYDEPQFFEYGGKVRTTQFVGSDWQFNQTLSITQRQFRKHLRGNTGRRANLSVDAFHRVNATTQVNFGAGLGWSRPRSKIQRNRSYSARMGVSRDFGYGITLGARLNLSKTSYWGRGGLVTKDSNKRTDKSSSVQILLSKRDLQIKGFSPQITISRNKTKTNAPARGYDRNLIELGLNRQL